MPVPHRNIQTRELHLTLVCKPHKHSPRRIISQIHICRFLVKNVENSGRTDNIPAKWKQ